LESRMTDLDLFVIPPVLPGEGSVVRAAGDCA
jgi:hypothetical protein